MVNFILLYFHWWLHIYMLCQRKQTIPVFFVSFIAIHNISLIIIWFLNGQTVSVFVCLFVHQWWSMKIIIINLNNKNCSKNFIYLLKWLSEIFYYYYHYYSGFSSFLFCFFTTFLTSLIYACMNGIVIEYYHPH